MFLGLTVGIAVLLLRKTKLQKLTDERRKLTDKRISIPSILSRFSLSCGFSLAESYDDSTDITHNNPVKTQKSGRKSPTAFEEKTCAEFRIYSGKLSVFHF